MPHIDSALAIIGASSSGEASTSEMRLSIQVAS